MKPNEKLSPGDIVQLSPATVLNQAFAGCFMTVTEPKAFGAQGYVQALGSNDQPGNLAYYRATWEEMEATGGVAEWVAV